MDSLLQTGRWVFLFLIAALFSLTAAHYVGHFYSYLLFSISLNCFLFYGFREKRIFFETFLAIFFWLGFWLKFSIRVSFLGGVFKEAVGNFVSTPAAYDVALNITSIAVFSFMAASFIRERFLFPSFKNQSPKYLSSTFRFYQQHRKIVLTLFTIFFIFIGLSNYQLGIYQRGIPPRIRIKFISGIYTWLLLFGLSSVSAVFFDFELRLKRHPYCLLCLSLFETFVSNVSMLSRGMVINASSLLLGLNDDAKKRSVILNFFFKAIGVSIFFILFLGSIVMVSHSRYVRGFGEPTTVSNIKAIAIDRFVGIEGVMAVTSYPHRGWNLLWMAMQEKYSDKGTSFYDLNLITSPYLNDDLTKNHFISLPGVVAFLFYANSISFLIVAIFILYIVAALLELATYKFGGGNLILCSLIGQVIAYRYANFGYVPSQSYLLLGTIIANIGIFYLLEKFLAKFALTAGFRK